MSVLVRREQRSEGGHLAHVTIDNIGKLNSLNRELMIEIVGAVAALDHDPQLRLAVLSGAGERAFVGGADIGEIAALDHETARSFITLVHRCCDAFRRLPVPVIARIDGYTLGAGLELACACDLRVASERSVASSSGTPVPLEADPVAHQLAIVARPEPLHGPVARGRAVAVRPQGMASPTHGGTRPLRRGGRDRASGVSTTGRSTGRRSAGASHAAIPGAGSC